MATIASLNSKSTYPAQDIHGAWTLMFLNTDRNTLWGSAGGMVFVNAESWDVQDRFEWVAKTVDAMTRTSAENVVEGGEMSLFNPLNWKRRSPVALKLPAGKSIHCMKCEALPDGRVLCLPEVDSSLSVTCDYTTRLRINHNQSPSAEPLRLRTIYCRWILALALSPA
jgi:hypothetical protein